MIASNARGIGLMLVSTFFLASMHSMVRYLSVELHPFELSFFRNFFGFVAILPLLIRSGPSSLRTSQPRLQVLRGLIGVTAVLTWFYGLSVVPIAAATAVSFTAGIFASVGAVLFLKERMRLRRWTAVFVGFAGVLVILRPGLGSVDGGLLIVLVSAMCWGISIVLAKQLLRTDSTVSIVAWMSIILTTLSFVPALLVWVWPTPTQLMWLAVIGGFASLGHLAMVQALRLSDATAVLPIDFMRLIWASVIGFLAFAEIPDTWTWVGGIVIFSSATYLALRETHLEYSGVTGPSAEHRRVIV